MKVKTLVNFKCGKTILFKGTEVEGDLLKFMDEKYSIETLAAKGIIEITFIEKVEDKIEVPVVEETIEYKEEIREEKKSKKKGK